jgi:large subunit ribosomal protein L22
MRFKYMFNELNENMAKACGRDLSISTKKSVEICNFIRSKPVEKAKSFLERVIVKTSAVPMKRYKTDTGHKSGMAAGRYPIKTAEAILSIVKSAESNAQSKGLSTKDLFILHIAVHKASKPWHFGRKKRQKMKRSHIEVVVVEKKQQEKQEKPAKKETNEDHKKEIQK